MIFLLESIDEIYLGCQINVTDHPQPFEVQYFCKVLTIKPKLYLVDKSLRLFSSKFSNPNVLV